MAPPKPALTLRILVSTGGQMCVCWASGKGASQLLESQWGDYSAWVAWGKGKVETGKASRAPWLAFPISTFPFPQATQAE